MIGVIVPAHDAEKCIEDCVQALLRAAAHPRLACEVVEVIVVLDACEDRTGLLARSLGARTMDIRAHNPDLALQAGAKLARASGARWVGFTDADTVVAADWLVTQLALNDLAARSSGAAMDQHMNGEEKHRHFAMPYTEESTRSGIPGKNLEIGEETPAIADGFFGTDTPREITLLKALQPGDGKTWGSGGIGTARSVHPHMTLRAEPTVIFARTDNRLDASSPTIMAA